MGKTKLNSSHSEDPSCPARLIVTEAEVKFKLFKCHTAQGEHAQVTDSSVTHFFFRSESIQLSNVFFFLPPQALNVLQSVPIKQKQAKHHMALGKLYERGGPGMKRAAISCYKEVVKACPMAMEAAQKLMQLGVKAKDIQELTLEVSGGKIFETQANPRAQPSMLK